MTVNGGATFDISNNGVACDQIATLAGSGTVQLGGNGLVIFNGSTEFSGTINGSGGLGSLIVGGTQTLSGVNSYTNATQIDRGATLALKGNGSIASSAVVTFARSAGLRHARHLADQLGRDRRRPVRRRAAGTISLGSQDAHHHQRRDVQRRHRGWRHRRRHRRRSDGRGNEARSGRRQYLYRRDHDRGRRDAHFVEPRQHRASRAA